MIEVLRIYRVLEKTVSTARQLYSDTEACYPDGNTTFFKILDGILQGDISNQANWRFLVPWFMAQYKNDVEIRLEKSIAGTQQTVLLLSSIF